MIKNSSFDVLYINRDTSIDKIKSFFDIESEDLNALARQGVGVIHYQIGNKVIELDNYYVKNNKGETKLIGKMFNRSKDYSF